MEGQDRKKERKMSRKVGLSDFDGSPHQGGDDHIQEACCLVMLCLSGSSFICVKINVHVRVCSVGIPSRGTGGVFPTETLLE